MPADGFNTLISKIRGQLSRVAENEGAAIVSVIELALLYVELREKVRKRQWEKTVTDLGVCPRFAGRYLHIGASWWTQAQALSSDLLAQLPCDVHKLEWLSKLSREDLLACLKLVDCKTCSRGAVIKAVQRMLGVTRAASEEQPVTVKELRKRWADYIRRMVDAIDRLTVDDQTREQLLDELQSQFAEVEESLNPENGRVDPPPSEIVVEGTSTVTATDDCEEGKQEGGDEVAG